jgi:ribosomal protein L40E
MRHRSLKTQRVYGERRKIVANQLALYQVCERCGSHPSTDVHEMVGRGRGGSILDLSNLRCLCRICHDYITQNPTQAESEGFAKPSWSMRHAFVSDDAYFCTRCQLPRSNSRHLRPDPESVTG